MFCFFKKIPKISQINYFFSSTQIQDVFFYNFNGIPAEIDPSKSQQIQLFLYQIFNDKLDKGFKFAYSQFLEAFEQKDLEFFEESVEKNLYNKIKKSLALCQQNNYKICQTSEDSPIQTAYKEMKIHMGVKFNRQQNPQGMKIQEIKLFDYVQINLYLPSSQNPTIFPQMSSFETRPVLQVTQYLSSMNKLYIEDENGRIIAGENSDVYQTHKVTFETDQSGNDGIDSMSLIGAFSGLKSQKGKESIFRSIFIGDKCQWKISDFDYALKGNLFTK